LIGKGYGTDCCGLIKWAVWTGGDITKAPVYNANQDYSAASLYSNGTQKGVIGTLPEIPGVLVFMCEAGSKVIGHVGVYIGGGQVVEATKGSYGCGVVFTKLSGRGWTTWAKCHLFSYAAPAVTPAPVVVKPVVVVKPAPIPAPHIETITNGQYYINPKPQVTLTNYGLAKKGQAYVTMVLESGWRQVTVNGKVGYIGLNAFK
jgi:cell wall-associated NlpC family hydrolase